MNDRDFIADPCGCPECYQAGVQGQLRRRDPYTGELMHGFRLRRWYDARDAFLKLARQAVGPPGRHARGFEPLAREPGADD